MRTGTVLKLLMTVILTAASLSACSLEQRGQDGMARIQLNTRARSGGAARLYNIPGVSLPTASSYYVVDVEGEGIPRQIIQPNKCVSASPISSVMVPALVLPGESERTELELLVPVGARRKIRIYRVDLTFGAGPAPFWSENPVGFRMRNPQAVLSENLYVMAEAEIPFLNGDQTVTLVEKASAESVQNQCPMMGPPPISNGEVQVANYHPANQMALWNAPYIFQVKGDVTRIVNGASQLVFSSPAVTVSAGAPPSAEGYPPPPFILGGTGNPTLNEVFSRVFRWSSPVSTSFSLSLPYSNGTQASVIWSVPITVRPSGPPLSQVAASVVNGTGLTISGVSYPNTHQVTVQATREVQLMPADPINDVFGYYTDTSGGPALELVSPPPSASGNPCPLMAPGAPGPSALPLSAASLCHYYVRSYQHTGSGHYQLKLNSSSNGEFGSQSIQVNGNSALSLNHPYFGNIEAKGFSSSSAQFSFSGSPGANQTVSGNWAVPSIGGSWSLAIESVSLRVANGSVCRGGGPNLCGVGITPDTPTALTLPTHLNGSPLRFAEVVVKKTVSISQIYFYKQVMRFPDFTYQQVEVGDPANYDQGANNVRSDY